MLFTQLEFIAFLVAIVVAVWLARNRSLRNAILLAASYYFYAYWDWRFCGLLLLSTLVDFLAAQGIAASQDKRVRRRWLGLSLSVNLGVLGFFKYFNFFIDSASPLLDSIGLGTQTLPIVLPVGISFYTFQTLSYTIDVYRGVLRPSHRLSDFALYVAFFPQLVAGPIVRARELLPQFATAPTWSTSRFYGGIQQLLRGAVKKVLLADRLAEMVDVVFAGPDLYSTATVWIAVIAYGGQIYYDFSGYTDMAIGAAKMLGYRFPKNFRHPYLATSIADFWHRWHMTLSRWLRDYLYIPLGGNRGRELATYRNLLITMILGGLWHGAAWTFVLWGLLHGSALCLERCVSRFSTHRIYPVVGWATTMIVVFLGWVLFRSPDLATAKAFSAKLFFPSSGIHWYPPLVLAVIVIMMIEHIAWQTRARLAMRLPAATWYAPIATVIMLWCLLLYAPVDFQPFVYFQF
ncbi:MBOAT family O-acyltransferase [Novipirellula artificiosorum]|uniref:Peptidoglycan O-acetyltransferase n=1 Tax=Novipirellula artificiosorum TaxID=2528016 RepID=A0A5C6E2S4_9BACT|nr:MBOAT family protein [Novipirellula artificiosorum]TWU42804.1 Peptidoglycan O-acetyltransferase [Novipirellula artificiosorum]